MVKSIFTHDTELALQGVAALVNTATLDDDGLIDGAALDRFVEDWSWTGSRTHDAVELEAVRTLRPRLRRLWQSDTEELVDQVNDILRTVRALPQMVRHDGWDWHLHATSPEAPLADRMAVEAAMALIDVVRQGDLGRLRTCAAGDCEHIYVDLSRNSSKRYCSTTCANRVNMAAFRSRQA